MARPFAFLIPTLLFLLVAGTPFLRLQPGHPEREHPAGRAREPRRGRRPRDRLRRPARPSPITILATVAGDPTIARRTSPALGRLRGGDRCRRRHRPDRGPVQRPSRPGDGRRPHARPGRRRCTRPRATSSRRSSRPRSTSSTSAYIRGSTVRLDADQPDRCRSARRAAPSSPRSGRVPSTASRPRSAGSPPRATTSWPARAATVP